MTGSYKTVRRFTILGAVVATLVLVDGLVLLSTNGLNSDATAVFPVLGGAFTKTRSSGASLIVLGVMIAIITLAGWWILGRRLRAEEQQAAANSHSDPHTNEHATNQDGHSGLHDG